MTLDDLFAQLKASEGGSRSPQRPYEFTSPSIQPSFGSLRNSTTSPASASNRILTAEDLAASLSKTMGSNSAKLPRSVGANSPGNAAGVQSPSAGQSKDYLLNLIKTPGGAKAETKANGDKPGEPTMGKLALEFAESNSRAKSPPHQFDFAPALEHPTSKPSEQDKASKFTFVNPFAQLNASINASTNSTPKATSPALSPPRKVDIAKHQRDGSDLQSSSAPATKKSKKATVEDEVEPKKESVSQALEGVGEKVNKQVEKALAKAEKKASPPDPASFNEVQGQEVDANWETAEDSASGNNNSKVTVYNFPMKPFVSITIGNDSSAIPSLDKERLLHLARFKMSFDAVNRNLITARQSHFAYARIGTKRDNNYLRLVHQGTGTHQQLFARNTERIFNIQCCGTYIKPERDMQILLCTGIDGTVFWARLVENSEAETITIPPYPAAEDASPNSMVKTRAKCSSCHPEFFALSRTRMIYIVSPNIFKGYVDEKSRKVHTVKYIDDHCLRINTGKACKDYIFAGDDSMILTVDKANAIKFWDIGELTRLAGDVMEDKHWKEITEPVMTLTAKSPGGKGAEKMSAFSVTLLDKERPHNKKAALRYMLVGFKQNYVLQLWDLALGKVVQELRLPHTDGSGFCSINYHPRTSIITLGHPARNSVFFFHVSAPKYNLPPMSQAQYVNMLASGDPNLPRMESTAIISGVREMSLANCGQLYSLDLLPTPVDDSSAKEQGTHSLFELYIYHSRGCDAFPIKPADLGWDSLLRLTGTVDSSKTDFIRMEPLEESGDEASPPKGVRKPTGNAKTGAEDTEQSTKPLTEEQPGEDQKESKDEAQEEPPTVAKSTKDAEVYEPSVPLTNDSMPNLINDNFQSLYKRLDADKRVSEAAGAAKQDAILRLISSTLTDNVHQSLSSIVNASIEASVVPSLVKVIDDTLGAKLGPSIRREISNTLPNTLKQALMDSKVHNAIANVTACSIQKEIAQQIHTINKTTQSVLDGFESRNTKRFQAAEAQRREDQAKIQQLTDMVEAMSLKVQELASAKQAEREEPKMAEESQLKTLSEEVEEIKNELVSGNFEAGTIMWIKSARKIELFDELFSMVNPQYLTEVSTLAQVSVTAALTSSFDTLVHERLDYLSTVLSMMDTRDKDVAPILSTVMGVLAQRLHSLQLVCSCASPKDEDLVKKIQLLHDHAKFLEQMATSE